MKIPWSRVIFFVGAIPVAMSALAVAHFASLGITPGVWVFSTFLAGCLIWFLSTAVSALKSAKPSKNWQFFFSPLGLPAFLGVFVSANSFVIMLIVIMLEDVARTGLLAEWFIFIGLIVIMETYLAVNTGRAIWKAWHAIMQDASSHTEVIQ